MAKNKMKVLAIIPARGGSKGLPRKNILPAHGKPLIAWTVEAAKKACCISRVILSSDDDEIIEIAKKYGCDAPFKRPEEHSTDTSSAIDVVLHALDELSGYDYVMLLQPTSPLRRAEDIDAAFELMCSRKAPSCVSLKPVSESPFWMYSLDERNGLSPLVNMPDKINRRQDLPAVYALNGAIYIAQTDWIKKNMGFVNHETIGYVMPRKWSLDIDTADDFDYFLNCTI